MIIIAWLLFLAMLFVMFQDQLLQRNNPNQNIVTSTSGAQKEVVLLRNAHGHYVTNGTINQQAVVFLLDTGATEIAIPESIANKLGLQKGRVITVKTANGNTLAYRTRLDSVAIGEIVLYNLSATILGNFPGNEVLLGMNFLKNLELIQKGKTLTIKQ